ncbi:hypothetical protein FQA39_LY07272 [Lamprigera yunnana]|nr:hypothetical protein FQA39_LY07272 [Lamprigera yunnana]
MTTEEKFQAAVNVIRSLPKNGSYQPSNELMLRFYAYFKQATQGPCANSRPPFWDVIGRAKYDAYKGLGNMSKQEAMKRYVDELHRIVETMSYSDKVENFLEAPPNELDSLNMTDVELIVGDVIEKVRSRSNSPIDSRNASPDRLISNSTTPSDMSSSADGSDHSDDEYIDSVEIPELKKSFENSAHQERLINGYGIHKESTHQKNKDSQTNIDVSEEIANALHNLRLDVEKLGFKVNVLENIAKTTSTKEKEKEVGHVTDENVVYTMRIRNSPHRTGIGAFNGQYGKIPATHLGRTVIEHCLKRTNISAEKVSEVIMGQVLTAGQGQNPARIASINAGIPLEVPAYTINMLCGSSLKAVCLGYQGIKSGDSEIVICGGQESMSMAQHSAHLRAGVKLGGLEFKDTLLVDGLTDAFEGVHMGVTAEFVAKKYSVSRESQDNLALQSQQRAAHAIKQGYFDAEIVPVIQVKPPLEITKDEYVRLDTTLEKLSKLSPIFEKDPSKNPTVTAGNASGVNDGAAAVIICNETQLKAHNLKPMAKIVACAESGLEPMEMGLGPINAIKKVLKKANWNRDEVDLYEINEAFASIALVVSDHLGLDNSKVNISGGAVALGHPIGASGARVLVTLLYNLERLNLKKGIASLCIGGGMGIALAIDRS